MAYSSTADSISRSPEDDKLKQSLSGLPFLTQESSDDVKEQISLLLTICTDFLNSPAKIQRVSVCLEPT